MQPLKALVVFPWCATAGDLGVGVHGAGQGTQGVVPEPSVSAGTSPTWYQLLLQFRGAKMVTISCEK